MRNGRRAKATYLYCLVHSKHSPSLAGVPPGLPGMAAPRLLDAGRSLWLVAADAPLALYGKSPIEARLQDLNWVAARAMKHEQVIEHFGRARLAVIPMKIFTLFGNDERALADIAGRRRELDAAIKRVAGRQEWGVRISLNRPRVAAALRVAAKRRSRGTPSGTQFLLLKKKEKDLARLIEKTAAADAVDAYEELARHAKEARHIPRSPDEASARAVMDAAFLVPAATERRFQEAVERLTVRWRRTYDVTLTGPWPPYNFVARSHAGAK